MTCLVIGSNVVENIVIVVINDVQIVIIRIILSIVSSASA